MNQDLIFEFTAMYMKEMRSISLKCADSDSGIEDAFGVVVFNDGKNEYCFSFEKEKFSLPLASIGTGCLVTCGISLAGPIIDCYGKSKGKWKKFKKCLREQGFTLGAATVACIVGCLSGNLSTPINMFTKNPGVE